MAYSIEEGDRALHKQVILDLWQRNFPEVAQGRFVWMYENNPSGPPIIFLLKHEESGSLVGALALFPRRIFVHGVATNAYICGDLVVDAQHRTLGPAIFLLKAAIDQCKKEPPCILLSFPIKKSEKVAERAGFMVLGEHCQLTKVIRSSKYFHRYIQSKLAVRALSSLFDSFFYLFETVFHLRLMKKYKWQVLDSFDQRFDEFWKTISSSYAMIGERSAIYLNWRIKESPFCRSKVFVLLANGSLYGYIAFTHSNTKCEIIDLAYGGTNEQLRTLLQMFTRYQRFLGTEVVATTITGHKSIINQFRKLGFSLRNSENKVMYYSKQGDSETNLFGAGGIWYLTDADNDI